MSGSIVRHLRGSICTMKWRENESIKLCHGLFGFQQVSQPFRTGWFLRCKIYRSVWRTWKEKCPSRNRVMPWALRDLSGLPASFTYAFSLLIEGFGLSYSMLIFILPSGLLIHNSGFTPSQITSRSTAKSDLFHISHKMAHHCKRNTPQTKLIFPRPRTLPLSLKSQSWLLFLHFYRIWFIL